LRKARFYVPILATDRLTNERTDGQLRCVKTLSLLPAAP